MDGPQSLNGSSQMRFPPSGDHYWANVAYPSIGERVLFDWSPEAVPALSDALAETRHSCGGHAGWALGRIACGAGTSSEVASTIAELLGGRKAVEEDGWVREEISLALGG